MPESPAQISTKSFVETICESCGANFPCGASVGDCWCFALNLETETLTALREKFERCLCENCLNSVKQFEILKNERLCR